ncbi:MAG: hypothetical protein ACPL1B_10350 [Thermoprotei archaeon]
MKIYKYLNNLMEILTVGSMIINRREMEIWNTTAVKSDKVSPYLFDMYLTDMNVEMIIFAEMRAKLKRPGHAFLRIAMHLRDAMTIEIIYTKILQFENTATIRVRW